MLTTKQHILNVFNDLLKTTPFDKITVSRIIQQAHIAKATFYSYYLDKFDLMNYNYKYLIDTSIEKYDDLTWELLFELILTFMEQHSEEMRSCFDTFGSNCLHDFMFQYSMEVIIAASQYERNCKLSIEEHFICSTFCHGAISISNDWLSKRYDLSAKEAGQLLSTMLPVSIKALKPKTTHLLEEAFDQYARHIWKQLHYHFEILAMMLLFL